MATTAPSQWATFNELPAELRNRIYHLAGVTEKYQCHNCTLIRGGSNQPNTTQNRGMQKWCPTCVAAASALGQASVLSPYAKRFLWVNRSSHLARPNNQVQQGARTTQLDCRTRDNWRPGMPKAWTITALVETVEQPGVTKIGRKVRNDTLPIYYGNTIFIFTIFDLAVDGDKVAAWLKTIGRENAASLRDVRIVYRSKDVGKWIMKELLREMRNLGVKAEETDEGEDVVKVDRVAAPYCFCEGCVRRAAGIA